MQQLSQHNSQNTRTSSIPAILEMAQQIFQNIDCYRQIQSIDTLKKEQIYFEICKLILSDVYMDMIQQIQDKSCSRADKIQGLINIFARMIGDNLEHITGVEIARGNLNHIYNFLQVLEYFSGYMDGQYSEFNKKLEFEEREKSLSNLVKESNENSSRKKKTDEKAKIMAKMTDKSNKRVGVPKERPMSSKANSKNNKSRDSENNNFQAYRRKPVQHNNRGNGRVQDYNMGFSTIDEMNDIRVGNLQSYHKMNQTLVELEREKIRVDKEDKNILYQEVRDEIRHNMRMVNEDHLKLVAVLKNKLNVTAEVSDRLKVSHREVVHNILSNVHRSKQDMKTKCISELRKEREELEELIQFDWGAGEKLLKELVRLRKSSAKGVSRGSQSNNSSKNIVIE